MPKIQAAFLGAAPKFASHPSISWAVEAVAGTGIALA
jgi:hypothetical protein